MNARMFLESLEGGWLPRHPFVSKHQPAFGLLGRLSRTADPRAFLGGLYGLAWLTLSFFVAAGAVYVVGRSSIWYDAIDVGLMASALLFFLTFRREGEVADRRRMAMAVGIGVAGVFARFAVYATSRIVTFAVGLGAVQQIVAMRVYGLLAQTSTVLIGLSILVLGFAAYGRFFRWFNFACGAILACAGGLGLLLLALSRNASLATAMGSSAVILWLGLISLRFLSSGRPLRNWSALGCGLAIVVAEVLVFQGVLWLPDLARGDLTPGFSYA